MQPSFSVRKRVERQPKELQTALCLVCQRQTDEGTRAVSSAGLDTFKDALATRTKFNCEKYCDIIDLLDKNTVILNDPSQKLFWHKTCFSSFSSKSHLERMRKRYEKNLAATPGPSQPRSQQEQTTMMLSRSAVTPADFKLCIFCQDPNNQDVRQVMTFPTSEKILNHKDCDLELSYRLAGLTDLVAAEVRYHKKCYSKFTRDVTAFERSANSFSCTKQQACFRALIVEAQDGLRRGHVFTVKSVWERYKELAEDAQVDTMTLRWFRDMLQSSLDGEAEFVAQESKKDSLLIFPVVSKEQLASIVQQSMESAEALQSELELRNKFIDEDIDSQFLKSLYHVGTKLRAEIQNVASHNSYDGIGIDNVEKTVPENLFLLLSIIVGNNEKTENRERILSLAQDVIYVGSGCRTLTPKHVGLASTVHHATRSKSLVQLLNAAGHCASYETVEKLDTSIAKTELEMWNMNGGVLVPSNVEMGKFTQFAADNINIAIETLDGKSTFNATQYAVYQYGNQTTRSTNTANREIGKQRCFGPSLPPDFHEILSSGYSSNKRPAPIFPLLETDWFEPGNECSDLAGAKDLAWFLCRNSQPDDQKIPSWTGFNLVVSTFESDVTTVGHMPIIPSPADDMNTVFTVLAKCKAVSQKLDQTYTVITFDQALFCRAKEMVWSHPDEFQNVIIRLGGFHIAMNFMKAIGKYMESSGLGDAWVESGVFGETTANHMLAGNAYNKAIRGHKLTYESLWRILWPKFLAWAEENEKPLDKNLLTNVRDVVDKFSNKDDEVTDSFIALVEIIAPVLGLLKEFDKSQSQNPTFKYWRQYMDMVSILMGFIRADREGNWSLHLEMFGKMLPWFALYDHYNYTRWGPVYLADMKALPSSAPEVFREFVAGKFSVKRTDGKFRQIATDQALEHVNRIAKVSGGIVGIAHLDSSRDRWCLTYNERARISDDTLGLFGQQHDDVNDDWTHRDSGKSGLKRDEEDVRKLMGEFQRNKLFTPSHDLVNLSTNDIAPEDIISELLSAREKGQNLVSEFVETRFVNNVTDFYSRIPQVKAKTLGTMYKAGVQVKNDKITVVKAERDIFRRLLVVRDSGRDVDLASVLQHELAPVPLSLVSTKGKLNPTTKADLGDLLTQSFNVKRELPTSDRSTCVLIDGPAVVKALGKPKDASTFQGLGDAFVKVIHSNFKPGVSRVDVLFDRYFDTSIKDGTRFNRVGKFQPVRRMVDSGHVKLPHNWDNFINHKSNKSDLAAFLSHELMKSPIPPSCELVTGGGFHDINQVWTSMDRDVGHLQSAAEEADTRIFLHAKDASDQGYQRLVINSRDTDVLVLALGHRSSLSPELWIHAGTSKEPKYIPVHLISLAQPMIDNLMAFHAISGCDTTSQLTGKGKKTCWKDFEKNAGLGHLQELGDSVPCSENAMKGAEKYVCNLYGHGNCESVDQVRFKMFVKGKTSIEGLPPTSDALKLHLMRTNYQTFVWKNALKHDINLPSPDGNGWAMTDGKLSPVFMTIEPVPKTCLAMISCSCKKGCTPSRCGCFKAGFSSCTSACACEGLCLLDE